MPTRRFDGPDLESSLAKAVAELGAGVRILGAEKVRSGGVAGFFSREHVEVEVEIGVHADRPSDRSTDPGEEVRPTPATATTATTTPHAPLAAGPSTPTDLLELADLVSDVEETRAAKTAEPPVEWPARPSEPVVTVSTEGASFAAVFGRMLHQSEPAIASEPATGPVQRTTAAPTPAPAAAPATRATAAPAAAPAPPAAPAPAAVAAIDAVSTVRTSPVVRAAEPTSAWPDLEALGLTPALIPTRMPVAALRQALAHELRSLPATPALPTSKGTVMAVVGSLGEAILLASDLAEQVGADPSTLVVVTTQSRRAAKAGIVQLTTNEEIDDYRRSWRWRTHPTVVVIDAPPETLGRGWPAAALARLEPTMTWGVTEASRKPEDVEAWSSRLGGFDALALTDTDATVSPAGLLRLGVPVGILDGELATPERWADLLVDRLAA